MPGGMGMQTQPGQMQQQSIVPAQLYAMLQTQQRNFTGWQQEVSVNERAGYIQEV